MHVRGHTKKVFGQYNILTVYNIYSYMTILHLAKLITSKTPLYLYDLMRLNYSSETRNNRVYEPHLSLKHYMNNFCYQGPKLWNAISSSSTHCESITAAPTISCLKSHLKKFFINMQSYGDENEWQLSNNDLTIFLTTLKSDPYSNLKQIT